MRKTKKRYKVAATEAAKGFGALMDRVRESGAVYEIESRGQVVAEIGPARRQFTVADLRALVSRGPGAPADLLDAIETGRRDARRESSAETPVLSGLGGRRRK